MVEFSMLGKKNMYYIIPVKHSSIFSNKISLISFSQKYNFMHDNIDTHNKEGNIINL